MSGDAPRATLPAMTTARKMPQQEAVPVSAEGDGLAFRNDWEREVERRADELRSGRVTGIPVEEAEAEIDAELGWG
jgi:hypothetical protein